MRVAEAAAAAEAEASSAAAAAAAAEATTVWRRHGAHDSPFFLAARKR